MILSWIIRPAAQLAKLKSALQQYASVPDNTTFAQSAVTAAKGMASALNDATTTVQSVRANADDDIATSVGDINQLLSQFQTANTAIVKGTITGADVTDYLDTRDNILSKLSQEVGITVATRANNDTVIYTDSGVTLFEKSARTVTFAPTNAFAAGTTGNAVYIDGVPVTGASAVMPIHAGKLFGLSTLRDKTMVTYQGQLDEVARGLIETFAEHDQSGAAAARRRRSFHLPRRTRDSGIRNDAGRPGRNDFRQRGGRSERWRQSKPDQGRRHLRHRRL